MATKKQKRERGIAKREAFEAEQRENGLKFLRQSQAQRTADREKAEEARKARAKVKSKQLAKAHRREKKLEEQGVQKHKPAPVSKLPRPEKGIFSSSKPEYDAAL